MSWLRRLVNTGDYGYGDGIYLDNLEDIQYPNNREGVVDEWLRRGSADMSQTGWSAVGRTVRLITSAALILFLAFVALASGPGTDLKTFASALGFGILLDATVVRSLLVPALVSMFGTWNWWMPHWAVNILRLRPAPVPDTALAE